MSSCAIPMHVLTDNDSAVFQAGGLVVVVVEVTRKAFLASLVPVIIDAILNEHQVVADIVSFVSQGDFPRSRLGEKQRGKVLASWVTRKLRTIAQFNIRDSEGPENLFAEAPHPRASKSSKPGSLMANSIRRSTTVPENDVPRSPAPVPEEIHELQSDPHHENQEQGEPAELYSPPAAQETGTPIPQISEPTTATEPGNTNSSENIGGASTLEQLDFGSEFAEFANRASTQPAELSTPSGAAEPAPLQLPQGRDSLPSQKRFSSIPPSAPPSAPLPERGSSLNAVPQPENHDENIEEDWPQEALMYQSAFDGNYDQDGVQRAPINATEVRKRHDYSF